MRQARIFITRVLKALCQFNTHLFTSKQQVISATANCSQCLKHIGPIQQEGLTDKYVDYQLNSTQRASTDAGDKHLNVR